MTTTQELFDYEQAALASFASAIKQSPVGEELNREVARLEGKLEQLHGVAVMAARRTDQIEEVTAIWQTMMQICEHFAQKIQDLARAHPDCQASYDKVLDLLTDCKERHQFHA
jgi:uncharacterized protein with PhoU and TrkA domain